MPSSPWNTPGFIPRRWPNGASRKESHSCSCILWTSRTTGQEAATRQTGPTRSSLPTMPTPCARNSSLQLRKLRRSSGAAAAQRASDGSTFAHGLYQSLEDIFGCRHDKTHRENDRRVRCPGQAYRGGDKESDSIRRSYQPQLPPACLHSGHRHGKCDYDDYRHRQLHTVPDGTPICQVLLRVPVVQTIGDICQPGRSCIKDRTQRHKGHAHRSERAAPSPTTGRSKPTMNAKEPRARATDVYLMQ